MNPEDAFRAERAAEKAVGGKMKLIAIVVALILVVIGGFIVVGSGKKSPIVAKDGKLTDAQSLDVKTRVEKLIKTPQEQPVMAVVTQAEALIKEQPFYVGVENGDILLIYPQTGKAILYSAKQDMLLNVGPVQVGDQKTQNTPASTNTTGASSNALTPSTGSTPAAN